MPDVSEMNCSTGQVTERDFTPEERKAAKEALVARRLELEQEEAEKARQEAIDEATKAAEPIVAKLEAGEDVDEAEQKVLLKALAAKLPAPPAGRSSRKGRRGK